MLLTYSTVRCSGHRTRPSPILNSAKSRARRIMRASSRLTVTFVSNSNALDIERTAPISGSRTVFYVVLEARRRLRREGMARTCELRHVGQPVLDSHKL